jgi:AraC-like DNA-binding protein
MYQILGPHKFLQSFIECYWILRVEAKDNLEIGESIFVDGNSDLIFNFGSPYRRVVIGEKTSEKLIAFSNLDATRLEAVKIAQRGDIHLLGVRFKPGGLAAFLPHPMGELTNHVVEVDLIFGSDVWELEARLQGALGQPAEQIRLLENFLFRRLQPRSEMAISDAIAGQIRSSNGQIDMHGLSKTFGYSQRHIRRLYQSQLGLSPKFHARIARFQQALHTLLNDSGFDLPGIAAACGYYDQSHLNKEFAAFAGQSPGQYRVELLLKTGRRIPPNLVRFLQDT